jgi:predicted dehydrogenase
VLFDTGYHFIDLMAHLFGPVRAVTALCWGSGARPRGRPDDHANVTLELSGGTVAVMTCSWAAPGGAPAWQRRFICEYGVIAETDTRPCSTVIISRRGHEQAIETPGQWEASNSEAISQIISAILAGSPSDFDAAGARHTLSVLLACYHSSSIGGRVRLAGFDPGSWQPDSSALAADYGFPSQPTDTS